MYIQGGAVLVSLTPSKPMSWKNEFVTSMLVAILVLSRLVLGICSRRISHCRLLSPSVYEEETRDMEWTALQ